jgi:DNA-directed RNA polymerase specialized sigma subunit
MNLNDAINKTVYGSGLTLKEIAHALDYSPSDLSRRCNYSDSIQFPLEKLPKLMQVTGNYLILEVLAELAGFDLKPKEKSPTALTAEVVEAINELPEKIRRVVESINGK